MKFFVPRYRHTSPSTNSRILVAMFLEIDERNLPSVINRWKELDRLYAESCADLRIRAKGFSHRHNGLQVARREARETTVFFC